MRYWSGRENDDGSIHCLGNGELCVYEQGPDIIQVFGPPYSAPSIFDVLFPEKAQSGDLLHVSSCRRSGSAIWDHTINSDEHIQGAMTDFVSTDHCCFVRHIETAIAFDLHVRCTEATIVTDNSALYTDSSISESFILYHAAGKHIYNDYPLPHKIFFQILLKGSIRTVKQTKTTFTITINPGESTIFIIGGHDFTDCRQTVDKLLPLDINQLINSTYRWWMKFTERRHPKFALAAQTQNDQQAYLSVIDSVSVLIKTQQSIEGGVLAGHNYHMGYVRDQYGVFRCLLKLGYYDEAKSILMFYWKIWQDYGKICNAQCMGVPGLFHVHENDEVEITGYIVIQAINYADVTGDNRIISEIMPMLVWAYNAQKKHLIHGMLPFNGDETYIAGGILPRHTLNDGSAEATLLFITGSEKLLRWVNTHPEKNWSEELICSETLLVSETKSKYKENFFIDGVFCTNNPNRKKWVELPRFRHGVCEGCLNSNEISKPMSFGWTEKNCRGRYLCPICTVSNSLNEMPDEFFFLQSVSLMPLYIGSDLLTQEEIMTLLNPIIDLHQQTGRLPSRPDGNITVGYDYGLFLYTLTELNHPYAETLYQKLMAVIDPTGGWVEYYINDIPCSTRYRPWESGINLEAAIHYIEKKKVLNTANPYFVK